MNEAFKHKRDYSLTGEQPTPEWKPGQTPLTDNAILNDRIKHEQPKPTLEGPHWDEICAASRAESNYAKCFTDLRSAVRELQSGINSINGKVGS